MQDITRTEQYKEWQREHEKLQRGDFVQLAETRAAQMERIERAQKDYAYFVRTYFPKIAKTESAKFQIDAANCLRKNQNIRAVFEWARGHAKSTHMGVFVPLWLKIQKSPQFHTMVLVSKSEDSAIRLLADLQAQFAYNKLYIKDFGKQMKTGNWAEGEFTTDDNCHFVAIGRGQSPRGLKHEGHPITRFFYILFVRPLMCLCEDC